MLGIVLIVIAAGFFLSYLLSFLNHLQKKISVVSIIFGTIDGLLLALTAAGVCGGYRLIKSGV